MLDRRTFVLTTAAGVPAAVVLSRPVHVDDPPAALESDLVERYVGRSHFDFDAVRDMLKAEPSLVNACWDWGGGDFETGLGAAAHTGRRNIAELILDHGGRLDLFAATMLGMSAVVRAAVEAMPDVHAVPGPHQIPLLSHAVVGRERSFELVEFLIARGAAVNAASRSGMTPLMMAASVGSADAARLLLEHGAERGLRNAKGETALDLARRREHEAVAALLAEGA